MKGIPSGPFDIVYADPPWPYYGDPNKNAAAGKHYPLMSLEDIIHLPVRRILGPRGVVFLWATCPMLHLAIQVLNAWGLYPRGVPYVWIKTRKKDGRPIGARGVPPTFTKPLVEMVLAGTILPRGRPFPILTSKQAQTVFAPVGRHSEKPDEVRRRIEELCGDRPRLEMFARKRVPGWKVWGAEV